MMSWSRTLGFGIAWQLILLVVGRGCRHWLLDDAQVNLARLRGLNGLVSQSRPHYGLTWVS